MTALFLTRARLRRDGGLAALARLLVPEADGARTAAAHRLIWSLFCGAADQKRDFLWREEAPGQFLALSPRPPANPDGLFEVDYQDFAPLLAVGDRLGFRLRANPVVARAAAGKGRGKRHDVVMDALHSLPVGERAAQRLAKVVEVGGAWIARQGEQAGFSVIGTPSVDGYETVRLPREGVPPIRFGQLDIEGVLRVEDPARFMARLAEGFGRSRAFGCGLMLIRRAV
jgi:CRISPR system Cascade subunit CasE